MCSAIAGDLTTRARIRNAAIELIGTNGFERASMRLIAQTAGVSPALVVHHFGDKNSLRAACNSHVTELFTGGGGEDPASQLSIEAIQAALQDPDAYGPAMRYLMRMLVDDDSGASDELFDGILQGTLRSVREQEQADLVLPQADPEASALLLTVWGLAPLVLGRHFARSLGATELTPAVLARVTLPLLEMLTHGYYRDDSILNATKQALESEERN